MNRRYVQALAFVVALVGVGVGNYLLTASGYQTAGSALYFVGYASIVLAAWYVWIRPLDIGRDGSPTVDDAREE